MSKVLAEAAEGWVLKGFPISVVFVYKKVGLWAIYMQSVGACVLLPRTRLRKPQGRKVVMLDR